MKKPSRYFVPYEDERLWQHELARVKQLYPGVEGPEELTEPTNYWRDKDFDSLEDARAFAKEHANDVYERVGIQPVDDAPGLWEYDERMVA